jgi:hypothetical protein
MRKLLLVIAAAMALFTVGAFAASFAVQSEDIASGGNPVVACASNVDIDFNDPQVNSTSGAWEVTGAVVSFRNAADALVTSCSGFQAELALTVSGSTTSVDADNTVGGSSVTFGFSATNVENITGASVMVDGKTLSVDVP